MFGNNSSKEGEREIVKMSTENVLNTISKGTVVMGNITTKGDIRIEGKIVGTIICGSKLVIGENGYVEGNIDARNANIAGEVKGQVVVRELLQLQEKGKITGDIYTMKLAVQIGALFTGACRMGDDAKNVLGKQPEKIEEIVKREAAGIRPLQGGNRSSNGMTENKGKEVEEKSA